SVTPATMLSIRVRVSPCRALLSRWSSGRLTSIVPSSARSTVIGAATLCVRVPLGPFTVTTFWSNATSTPDGTAMGSLPIRDMSCLLLVGPSSPDVGEDFPTHALLVGLAVGQQALAGGDDRHAEATEDLRQSGRLRVDAQTGLADPPETGDRALAVLPVLQRQRQHLAHRLGRVARCGVLDLPAGDVALLLEDLRDARLELAVRHGHGLVVRSEERRVGKECRSLWWPYH